MEKLTRQAVVDLLRERARERCPTKKSAEEFFTSAGDIRYLRSSGHWSGASIHALSWDTMLRLFDQLGFELRFEIVMKGEGDGTGIDSSRGFESLPVSATPAGRPAGRNDERRDG